MLARRRSKNRQTFKFIVLILVLVFVLGGFIYVVWFSNLFTVRAIEVDGARLVDASVISGPAEGNILFWKLPVNVEDFPQVEGIEVDKNYAERSVKITVKERGKVLIWCDSENASCYWTDEDGLIFTAAPIPEGILLVNVVRDSTNRELKVGDHVLSEDLFKNLKYAIELLGELDISILEIRLDDLKFKEATAVIANGPEVYLSLTIDPRFGKGVLEELMSSPDWSSIRYVDLRVENRAYYSL